MIKFYMEDLVKTYKTTERGAKLQFLKEDYVGIFINFSSNYDFSLEDEFKDMENYFHNMRDAYDNSRDEEGNNPDEDDDDF